MGNVPKRQQPYHRADNSRRSPTGLQCNEKFSHPEASLSWPLNKYWFSDNEHHTKLQIVHKKLKVKIIQDCLFEFSFIICLMTLYPTSSIVYVTGREGSVCAFDSGLTRDDDCATQCIRSYNK